MPQASNMLHQTQVGHAQIYSISLHTLYVDFTGDICKHPRNVVSNVLYNGM